MIDAAIRALIDGFKKEGWKSEPMDAAMQLAAASRKGLRDLALAVMDELPTRGTFLDAALAFLPEACWFDLVPAAIEHLQKDPANDAAESVIEYASLQCLSAVHPFLTELFSIDRLFKSYYGTFPWRESGTTHLTFLADQLQGTGGNPPGDARGFRTEYGNLRCRANSALLETREVDAILLACSAAPTLGCGPEELKYDLWSVDCEIEDGHVRRLTPQTVHHLQFVPDYVDQVEFLKPWSFPTWEMPGAEDKRFRFGGLVEQPCGQCGKPLHHMITLSPVPSEIGVTSVTSLTLVTCLSCLGWEMETLFFQHDSGGQPLPLEVLAEKQTPQFPSPPLQETKVAIVDTPPRWRWQDWGMSNSRENLNRLGGHPCWVQTPDHPACPACGRSMPFLMQLDSELSLEGGDCFMWGSGGVAYFFWCDECRISANRWQCT